MAVTVRRLWIGALAVPVGIAGVGVGTWLLSPSRQLQVEPLAIEVDGAHVADILAEAVRVPTVSYDEAGPAPEALSALHAVLEDRFPRVHTTLERELVAGHSLLYTWHGSDPALDAVLLMAHQDVVPVESEASWTHPAFAGVIADGVVYGRGTLDDKQNVVAQLAAVEQLLAQGFSPTRTLHLAFGHDEEVSGSGARAIAEQLQARGVHLEVVLDEGGVVSVGTFDGLDAPIALVGISEKGYASVEIVAEGTGGHSSMPPASTAAGRIAAAVVALEDNPLPATLQGPTGEMLDFVGPEMGLPLGLVMANRWLLGRVVISVMSGDPKTNATIRTTTAVTQLQGSVKDNVLPQRARAVVNFRIAPGDTTESVLAHVRDTIADPELTVGLLEGIGSDPSPVSRTDGAPWTVVQTAIRQTWPDAVVAPYLTIGATDSRHFTGLSERVYRFSPMVATSADLDSIHGNDERISVDNLTNSVGFYVRLVQGLTR